MVTNKTKYIFIGIGLVLILSLYYFYNPVETDFFPQCPFHSLTGLYCAGCGSQRALHQLLHFNFIQTLDHNALYSVALLLILYNFIVNTINRFFNKEFYNYIYHPKTPLIMGVIVLVFWIVRNIDIHPFSILAP